MAAACVEKSCCLKCRAVDPHTARKFARAFRNSRSAFRRKVIIDDCFLHRFRVKATAALDVALGALFNNGAIRADAEHVFSSIALSQIVGAVIKVAATSIAANGLNVGPAARPGTTSHQKQSAHQKRKGRVPLEHDEES